MKKPRLFNDPWSPSKLAGWEQCPRKFKYKYVDKIPEGSPGPAADRGTMLHEQAELFIKGQKPLHGELKKVKPVLTKLRSAYKKKLVMVELALGFDRKWKRLPDWFHKDTWVRVKMDVAHLVKPEETHVIDWKTGRYKPEDPSYNDALSIYAVSSLATGWGVRTKASLIFTDHGEVVERPSGNLDLDQLVMAKEYWAERADRLYSDRIFPTRPGPYCRWCAYSTAKGGKCDF